MYILSTHVPYSGFPTIEKQSLFSCYQHVFWNSENETVTNEVIEVQIRNTTIHQLYLIVNPNPSTKSYVGSLETNWFVPSLLCDNESKWNKK